MTLRLEVAERELRSFKSDRMAPGRAISREESVLLARLRFLVAECEMLRFEFYRLDARLQEPELPLAREESLARERKGGLHQAGL